MKKLLAFCLSFGFAISLLTGLHIKNYAHADGAVEQDN